jgi:hypothetical protein
MFIHACKWQKGKETMGIVVLLSGLDPFVQVVLIVSCVAILILVAYNRTAAINLITFLRDFHNVWFQNHISNEATRESNQQSDMSQNVALGKYHEEGKIQELAEREKKL